MKVKIPRILVRAFDYCDERFDPVRDWWDKPLGTITVAKHRVSRFDVIFVVAGIVAALLYGWYFHSWLYALRGVLMWTLGAMFAAWILPGFIGRIDGDNSRR